MITELDVSILNNQTHSTLAVWHCQLNSWLWPEELPDAEKSEYVKDGRRSQIMHWIENEIGAKLISEEWNCRFDQSLGFPSAQTPWPEDEDVKLWPMTIEEHSEWWAADDVGKLALTKQRIQRALGNAA